jgi:adenine specific DNA methylase Mod
MTQDNFVETSSSDSKLLAQVEYVEYKANEGVIFQGDNLVLLQLLQDLHYRSKFMGDQQLKLVYIDPPFDSRAHYKLKDITQSGKVRQQGQEIAFSDYWGGLQGFIAMLRPRLELIRHLLAEDGCIYVHCDWRTSAHVRLLLDEIFGFENFQNEIIWSYRSGGISKRRFARKHDNIYFYSKSKQYQFFSQQEKSYNRDLKPYRFKGVKEYADDVGWYTMVSMRDVWEINMVGRSAGERNGYPTQKPEKLLERIILSATQPGDLVADFFCGSGTTLAVAHKLKRSALGCDSSRAAIKTSLKRLRSIL